MRDLIMLIDEWE